MRNFILSTFSALFLSLIAVGAQNSPIPGTYYIVNSVPSPADERFAATFQNSQSAVAVTPLTGLEVQQWIISAADANGAQFIIPLADESKAAAAGDNIVVVNPKNTFVTAWTIKNLTSAYYTIKSPTGQLWDLVEPINNANITLGESTGDQIQEWELDLVE